MSKKTKQTAEEPEVRKTQVPQEETPVSEPVEVPAAIKDYSFNAVMVDGKPTCPHCHRVVPKSALIDTEKRARLEERERKIVEQGQDYFRQMVKMANKARKGRGEKPLSDDEVQSVQERMKAVFG